jgi:hypothetical protein
MDSLFSCSFQVGKSTDILYMTIECNHELIGTRDRTRCAVSVPAHLWSLYLYRAGELISEWFRFWACLVERVEELNDDS